MAKKRLTKEQKQKFANAFLICQDGLQSLIAAGLEDTIPSENFVPTEESILLMQELVTDKYIEKYIDKHIESVQFLLGKTKVGHVARLQALFDMATGRKKSKVWKFTKDGEYVEQEGNFINYAAAAAISDRISKLEDWDTLGENVEVVVDLKITDDTYKSNEEAEKATEARDNKVEQHFKEEGLL